MTNINPATFRPEIQGLRAVAVASVLIYHIWPAALPGGFVGVDVFFVISGFLITEVLLRDVVSNGSINLIRFYARRIKRLLPAATVVLVGTSFCYSLLPSVSWESHAEQIFASTFYFQNWWLGLQAVDYLGSEQSPGPLQHFWSLSVEEQYYLVWPLLFLIAQGVIKRAGRESATILGWSIAAVFIVSLVHSIHYSHASPEMAYFASTTRAWELALGGLLAVASNGRQRSIKYNTLWSALGTALILASFYAITSESIFPGYIALLPTVGAAIVIMAGDTPSKFSPQAILRTPLFQYLGDISYSLYLWHWPVIIFYQHVAGRPLAFVDGVIVLAVSTALAHQTKVLIEDPFRQTNYWNLGNKWPFVLGMVCLIFASASAYVVYAAYQEVLLDSAPQAAAVASSEQKKNDQSDAIGYSPSALQASQDRPLIAKMGCHTNQAESTPRVCSFGDENSDIHLVLIGDSHAVQWAPAFRKLAALNGWRLTVFTKSACAFAAIHVAIGSPARRYEECTQWSDAVVAQVQELQPTHLVIGQSMAQRVYGIEDPVQSAKLLAAEYVKIWQRASAGKATIIAIRDTPRMPTNVPECLSTPGNDIASCSAPRRLVLDRENRPDPIMLASAALPAAHLLDFSDHICGPAVCSAVVENTLVWRDGHHLTATFVNKLQPVLASVLTPIVGRQVISNTGDPKSSTKSAKQNQFSVDRITQARADRPDIYDDGCFYKEANNRRWVCEYGDPKGQTHVVLAGDTRAGQWLPALQNLAKTKSLRVSTAITYGCALGDIPYQNRNCSKWTRELLRTINDLSPDIVFYSQSRGYRVPDTQRGRENALALSAELEALLPELTGAGAQLIFIPDTPRPARNVNECLLKESNDPELVCSVSKRAALPTQDRPDPLALVAEASDSVAVLDLSKHICPKATDMCKPLVDGELVWRSKYLVTASFAASLVDPFKEHIFKQ